MKNRFKAVPNEVDNRRRTRERQTKAAPVVKVKDKFQATAGVPVTVPDPAAPLVVVPDQSLVLPPDPPKVVVPPAAVTPPVDTVFVASPIKDMLTAEDETFIKVVTDDLPVITLPTEPDTKPEDDEDVL